MSTKLETIAQFDSAQISAINAYLVAENKAEFNPAQIHFLANLREVDVLGLSTHCNLIRGYLGDFEALCPHPLYVDINDRDYDDLMDEFKESLNPSDYDDAAYKALLLEKREEYRATMSHYGLILFSGAGESDVLFLNKALQPLYTKYIRFYG